MILSLFTVLSMLVALDGAFVHDHSVYSYDIHCLRNDPTGILDQHLNLLGTELVDYLMWSSNRTVDEKGCSLQITDTNLDLDLVANAFSGNVELNDFKVVSFSKIFDSLLRPSSIVLLFSIVVTGLVLNSLEKLRKNTNRVRKGFSQGTREIILRKQNYRCAYCKKVLNVIDYHHKNGNRSDNREKNCQALCPNCHAIKTRNKLVKN
ncbi:MAG: HNH endonuclease signature motif containing protein [Candidatus Nitrosocosmicus sp.]|nr:HNH endonuclease signature motif containing protein [Candidatus Nitrosocosmicus sp.]